MEHLNSENTQLKFTLKRWSAWLPDQAESDSLGGWPDGHNLASTTTSPELGFLPQLQRRRLTPLARAAIAVAWDCWQSGDQLPTIFSSTHGETGHCFNILTTLADHLDVSPTQFTFSVHSGIAAMFSILTGNKAPYIAMAPGNDNHSNALLEAYTLIMSQAGDVLVVFYDQPVPEVYRAKTPSPTKLTALALRLGLAASESSHHQLWLTKTPHAQQPKTNGQSLENMISKICLGETVINTDQYCWTVSR